jgi:inner membrane protein
LFVAVFWIFVAVALSAVGVTILWFWFKVNTPEDEAAPRWGDLRPLSRMSARSSAILRMVATAILAGLMTIPVSFIDDLTNERYDRYSQAVNGISWTWGASQTLAGPLLSVPYTVRYQLSETVPLSAVELALEQSRSSDRTTKEVLRTVEDSRVAVILPDDLQVEGHVDTELRSRSIYSTLVYTADLTVSGSFSKPDLSGLRPHISEVHWDKATLAVGLSDTKAIRGVSELDIAGQKHKFLPGSGGLKALPTGFSSPVDMSYASDGEPAGFRFDISVGGTTGLFFAPLGVNSRFRLSSSWPHPNFSGSGLPTNREITPKGFTAEWDIPNLVRNYPQLDDMEKWENVNTVENFSQYMTEKNEQIGHNLLEYTAGVEFFEPIFHYSLLIRSTKYAVLFIALTFLGVMIFENYSIRLNLARLNIAQYCIIGLGLSLFYLTLLALSEHLGFTPAYLIASAINVVMTSGYVLAALRRAQPAVLTAGVQAILYAMLFFILRMEDYALLAGTALLLLAMAALMIATRNINRPEPEEPQAGHQGH